jgi:uncharacterized protein
MTGVLMDTVGLLALFDEDDQWHDAAAAAFLEITRRADRVVTTSAVLLECGNALARSSFRGDLDELRRQLEVSGRLIRPSEADWAAAWRAYVRGEADSAGIVDHVSFIVMRRLGITAAFTNDKHFRAAGFEPLF